MNDFATWLQALKKRTGLTNARIAERVGITEAGVSLHVSGRSLPTRETIRAYADAFGVQYTALLALVDGQPVDGQTAELVHEMAPELAELQREIADLTAAEALWFARQMREYKAAMRPQAAVAAQARQT